MSKQLKILRTKRYSLFRPLIGNRRLDQDHVRRLMESMQNQDVPMPIIVNSKMQVIDGNHRLQARKRLGLEVTYIQGNGLGLKEVQLLNSNQKNWTRDDFAASYAAQGNKNYTTFLSFKKKWDLGTRETICLLTSVNEDRSGALKFKSGLFEVKSKEWAGMVMEKISELASIYSGYKRYTFITAMAKLFKHEQFNFDTFKEKLVNNPHALVHCVSWKAYARLIEDIYNYRAQTKVRFF